MFRSIALHNLHAVPYRLREEPVALVGGMVCTLNGASVHARQLFAVAQVPYSLYELISLGYVRMRSTFSSDTRGRPGLLPLFKEPVSSNCLFQ